MSQAQASPCHTGPTAEQASVRPKMRRKVRKGTQSCWECKRRKIRCTFSAPSDTVCDGCRSRRTRCISQQFHDEGSSTRTSRDRLDRMESLVDQLVNRDNGDFNNRFQRALSSQYEHTDLNEAQQSDCNFNPETTSTISGGTCDSVAETQVNIGLDHVSRSLLAVWPGERDLELILNIPIGLSVLLHGIVCAPYSRLISNHLASPRHMLKLPSPGSHPVLVARRLLLLGTLLQGVPSDHINQLAGMSSDYRALMSRVVQTATRLVTSNDELVTSPEAIECIMIEAMYLNNSGELRRAWMTNRRAMTVAQMMGLHNGTSSTSAFLEEATRERIDPDYMWFRLVCTDRYLSLILGLPQGCVDDAFASSAILESCTATERMERMMTVAGGLILQRTSNTKQVDTASIFKIDKLLQEIAALMPPQWWSPIHGSDSTSQDHVEAYEETIRLANQLAYHHLLVQLHLPNMLRHSLLKDSSLDYSKLTAATASRTILTQFVTFRTSFKGTSYCRGIDFVVFVASTVLCLAHIEACRPHPIAPGNNIPSGLECLRHQRPCDRGLLERTFEIMELMAETNNDIVAGKISGRLKPLLAVEENSARGVIYQASVSPKTNEQDLRIGNNVEAPCSALLIEVPFFGTIKIENQRIRHDDSEAARTIIDRQPQPAAILRISETNMSPIFESVPPIIQQQHEKWATNDAQSANAGWQNGLPNYVEHLTNVLQQPETMLGENNHPQLTDHTTTTLQDTTLLLSDLPDDIDDWALQGVDVALFNTLTSKSPL